MLPAGREIGRIYEVHAPTRPKAAWTWSIIVMGEARGHVTTDGNAPTFDEVKPSSESAGSGSRLGRRSDHAWRRGDRDRGTSVGANR
jgi:hypothetical protein